MPTGSSTMPAKQRRGPRRAALAGMAVATAVGMAVTTGAGSASAATAHHTGRHYVCANSLTVHNSGDVGILTRSDIFDIDHFGDGINHAWGQGYHWNPTFGWQAVPYGWVYNGWFC